MSDRNRFFRFSEMDAIGQDDAGRISANQNQNRQTAESSLLGYLTEGYALYAAAFYPPSLHGAKITRHCDVNLFRQPANETCLGMNKDQGDATLSASGEPLSAEVEFTRRESVLLRVAQCCGRLLLAPVRFIKREREIARSIRILSCMDDRGLRDIGISRSDIDHMVRYGRDDRA